MNTSNIFKIKAYPGEKAIRRGAMATGAAATSAGCAVTWFGTAGTLTKIGLAIGLVSPPVGIIVAAGIAGGIVTGALAHRQLLKKDQAWAEEILDD